MMETILNRQIVAEYIETIWNRKELASIDPFISENYIDYSFPPAVPPNKTGLLLWLKSTSDSFDHSTIIESAIAEEDQVAVRISFKVKHTGTWRNIPPTEMETIVKGFRFFKLFKGKIVAHWALIDGEALYTTLTNHHMGCTLPE